MRGRKSALETIAAAVATFVATNIDDLVLVTLFFAEAGPAAPAQVVVGQYLGFIALVLVSLAGFLGRLVFSGEGLGLLGLVPIAIGVHGLVRPQHDARGADTAGQAARMSAQPRPGALLAPRTYAVAAVTFANGGDNIGLYVPLFANSDPFRLAVTIATFLVLVAVLCAAAHRLARHPQAAVLLARHGRIAVPFVLIALGIYIILEAGTIGLLAG